jgi:hypothetical protein
MLETDKVFAGSIPENYDRYMVPLIFEPYATAMSFAAPRTSPTPPSRQNQWSAGKMAVERQRDQNIGRGFKLRTIYRTRNSLFSNYGMVRGVC